MKTEYSAAIQTVEVQQFRIQMSSHMVTCDKFGSKVRFEIQYFVVERDSGIIELE